MRLKDRFPVLGRRFLCYTVTMKKNKNSQNRKVNKKSVRRKPVGIFAVTLSLVILLGLLIIAAIKLRPSDKGPSPEAPASQEEEQSRAEEEEGKSSFWENVPKEPEALETAAVPENSRYGDQLADAEYRKANRIYAWEADREEEVTIGFVGDILFDDEYAIMANLLRRGGTINDGISDAMLAQLQGVDILVANNEFPYTNRGTPTEGKTFTFRADTNTVAYLHDMGVDAAVIANNHIYDFGEEGLLDTLETLTQAGIPYVGAGKNLEEASAPVYYIVNDMKIALVAATQIERLENPDTKGATENSAGVFRCLNPDKLCEMVRLAKENSDFVIVYIHWGTENVTEPDWAQLDQAPKLAEAGADLIIGDHPHCLQGITFAGNVPVIYSLGNFWFNSRTVDTGMVKAVLDQNGLRSLQFVPALQSDCRVDLVYGEEKERILNRMRELSPGVTIDQEGYILN